MTKELAQHDGYKRIEEARTRYARVPETKGASPQDYHAELGVLIMPDRKISDGFTLKERLEITLHKTKKTLKISETDEADPRAKAESRVLLEAIKVYNAQFNEKLAMGREARKACRESCERYADERQAHELTALEHGEAADDLRSLVKELEAKRKAASKKETPSLERDLHAAQLALCDNERESQCAQQRAKLAYVMAVGMRGQYECVAYMTSLLEEKGNHIKSVLTDYENGASAYHVSLLKQKAGELRVISDRVQKLEQAYAKLHQEAATRQFLPDVELDAAYLAAQKMEEKMNRRKYLPYLEEDGNNPQENNAQNAAQTGSNAKAHETSTDLKPLSEQDGTKPLTEQEKAKPLTEQGKAKPLTEQNKTKA